MASEARLMMRSSQILLSRSSWSIVGCEKMLWLEDDDKKISWARTISLKSLKESFMRRAKRIMSKCDIVLHSLIISSLSRLLFRSVEDSSQLPSPFFLSLPTLLLLTLLLLALLAFFELAKLALLALAL